MSNKIPEKKKSVEWKQVVRLMLLSRAIVGVEENELVSSREIDRVVSIQ